MFVTFQICSDTDAETNPDRIIGKRVEKRLAGIAVGSDSVGINITGTACCGVGRGSF
jgi:hypothetical protein